MAINPITLLVGFAENQLISWLTPDQEVDRLLKQTIAETFTEHGFPLTPHPRAALYHELYN